MHPNTANIRNLSQSEHQNLKKISSKILLYCKLKLLYEDLLEGVQIVLFVKDEYPDEKNFVTKEIFY